MSQAMTRLHLCRPFAVSYLPLLSPLHMLFCVLLSLLSLLRCCILWSKLSCAVWVQAVQISALNVCTTVWLKTTLCVQILRGTKQIWTLWWSLQELTVTLRKVSPCEFVQITHFHIINALMLPLPSYLIKTFLHQFSKTNSVSHIGFTSKNGFFIWPFLLFYIYTHISWLCHSPMLYFLTFYTKKNKKANFGLRDPNLQTVV